MKKFEKVLAEKLIEIRDPNQMNEILSILFTEKELAEIQKRGQILNRLMQGETQRNVAAELEVGIATVSRGAVQVKSIKNPKWWTSWLWR